MSPSVTPWRAWRGLPGILYQFYTADGGYNLLVTNLSEIYSEMVDATGFVKRLQELNPKLEATVEQAMPCLEEAIASGHSDCSWSGDVIQLSSRVSGVPLRWAFHLRALPGRELAGRLVRPLLGVLGRLQARERRLLAEVAARDRELDDYRRSGAHLTLKALRTEPLDVARFDAEAGRGGLRPADLLDPGVWEALPPEPEAAPTQPAAAEAVPAADGVEEEAARETPQKEDLEQVAQRRRRELEERLKEEAEREEAQKRKKRRQLNL